MKKINKRDLIFIIAVSILIIIGGLVIDNSLDKEDDNHLRQLKYNITEFQEDSLCGVTYDENDEIVRKTYAINENFLTVNIDVATYDTYEAAVIADDRYEYSEFHCFSENNNPGIEKIICGIINGGREYRGAMAWIYTECETYTILVKSMTRNYNQCEEMLHTVLSGISLDERN